MKTLESGYSTSKDHSAKRVRITPSIEIYWREQYRNEPYYDKRFTFADYFPAYILGIQNFDSESSFQTAENELSRQWTTSKGVSRLGWDQARDAVRAGWYYLKRVKKIDSPPPMHLVGLPGSFTRTKKMEYESVFGPYREDYYLSSAQCPEDRREIVAQIKVSSAAIELGEVLLQYASGSYPTLQTEKHKLLFQVILEWEPFLPR